MKMTIDNNDFRREFFNCGRENQFSHEGLGILFNWFEQLEEDMGEEIELDVIAICCDFSEAHWGDIASDYEIEIFPDDDEESMEIVVQYLEHHTQLVGITKEGNIIYQAF